MIMKKIIAFILMFILSVSFCVPAFAEVNINEIDGTYSSDVEEIKNDEELINQILKDANEIYVQKTNDNQYFSKEDISFDSTLRTYDCAKIGLDKTTTNKSNLESKILSTNPVYSVFVSKGDYAVQFDIGESDGKWKNLECKKVSTDLGKQYKSIISDELAKEKATTKRIYYLTFFKMPMLCCCIFENKEPIVFQIKKELNQENQFDLNIQKHEYNKSFKKYIHKMMTSSYNSKPLLLTVFALLMVLLVSVLIILLIVKKRKSKQG